MFISFLLLFFLFFFGGGGGIVAHSVDHMFSLYFDYSLNSLIPGLVLRIGVGF